MGFDGDVGGWLVVGLQEIVGFETGGAVGDDELAVLAAGLEIVLEKER